MSKDINKGRLLGAHCSIAGGISLAPERGAQVGCSAIQVFTKNSNQWKASPLSLKEIDAFREALNEHGIKSVCAHAGYLINLSTSEPSVHDNSMKSMRIELERAESLEIPYVVVHPGSHKGAGEFAGIVQLVENLKILMEETKGSKTQIVLETTAGQGNGLGHDFNQFAEVLNRLDWPSNIGICIDTAHIFAAGYDISTKEGYEKTMTEFDEAVGLDYVRVFHINDSKAECGARVDRHEQLGKGKIGLDGFKCLMNDRRFVDVPMILETPKGKDMKEDVDNLEVLRSLIK